MNKDKRNNIQLLGTLTNADESGIIANASQIYDGVAQKSVEERITDLDNKIESAVATETSRAQEAEANRYTKSETYNKQELNNLITTPNQEYVSATATSETTSVTDILPDTGAANTIYRVGNWDGSQYDTTCYTEYAWNGSIYVPLNTKEYGVDDAPTAGSDNLVKSGGAKSYTDEKASEIYTFLKDIHPALFKDSFIIADLAGNVAFEVDKKGNTTYVGKVTDVFSNYNKDEFIIADESGNIALRVNSTGVDYIGKITEEKVKNQIKNAKLSKLKGKNIFTLGDSLCTSGIWQNKLSELTGANFDNSINTDSIHPISYGGTTTSGNAKLNGGFQRAKNLVEYWANTKGASVDILFIENINDMQKAYSYVKTLDSIDIDPFFENQSIRLSNVFDSSTAFFSYAKEHLKTIAPIPAVGTVIYGSYKDNAKQSSRITVGSQATQAGAIKLKVGNKIYNINVPAGASKEEIVAKIEEVDYVGYYDILNDDGTIDFDIVIEIAGNTTGCELSLTTLDYSRQFVSMLFKSKNVNDFYNLEMWDTNNYFYLTLYRMYKGLLSYLTKNLPNTKIYWLFPTVYNVDFSNPSKQYVYDDGSFNYSAYMKYPETWVNGNTQDDGGLGGRTSALFDIQKEVCELFGVEYIDLHRKAGITLDNASEYYYNGNVHPKDKGYIKWAEEIFRQIG